MTNYNNSDSKQRLTHEAWMCQAIELAKKASDIDETPVGALIVKDNKVIGRGFNRRETDQDVTMHAEMIAIRDASQNLGTWRLDDCVLYVTLEPCIMCAGAIVQARVRQIVFGAWDPKAGAAGSVTDIFSVRQNHQVIVTGGVLAKASSDILKTFFRSLRKRNKVNGSRSVRRNRAINDKKIMNQNQDQFDKLSDS